MDNIHPIQYCIHESKIIDHVPDKIRDFSLLIPGDISTYIYKDESSYYKNYQESRYGITSKKDGWDCLRHLEILANGCIPYFKDLYLCPSDKNMFRLPRKLIFEAMNLPGVSYNKIDWLIFNELRYLEILKELLDYTRSYLTTRSMALYLLEKNNINLYNDPKILFLSEDLKQGVQEREKQDYMRCLILTGLKEVLGNNIIDHPKVSRIYTSYEGDIKNLYGMGMSYTKNINLNHDDFQSIDIEKMIRDKYFDLIIYGSFHRDLPLNDLVRSKYNPDKIIYICGEDDHVCERRDNNHILFIREYSCISLIN